MEGEICLEVFLHVITSYSIHYTKLYDADRVVIMDEGKIILDQPASKAFDYLEVFHRLGLRVPEPVELCHTLGIKASPLSAEEALDVLGTGNFKEKMKKPRFISNSEGETGIQTGSAGSNEFVNNGSVITSYSIHYTKLYDTVPS